MCIYSKSTVKTHVVIDSEQQFEVFFDSMES